MNDYLSRLIKKYKNKGVLIDTNIVLLYIVGSFDILLIREFSHTAMFTVDDFDKVSTFIDYFDLKITTPHILTEVSDLIGNRPTIQNFLKAYIEISQESFQESLKTCQNKMFPTFGLADTAISETSKESYLAVTNDNRLLGFLNNQKIDAVSLDQIRLI